MSIVFPTVGKRLAKKMTVSGLKHSFNKGQQEITGLPQKRVTKWKIATGNSAIWGVIEKIEEFSPKTENTEAKLTRTCQLPGNIQMASPVVPESAFLIAKKLHQGISSTRIRKVFWELYPQGKDCGVALLYQRLEIKTKGPLDEQRKTRKSWCKSAKTELNRWRMLDRCKGPQKPRNQNASVTCWVGRVCRASHVWGRVGQGAWENKIMGALGRECKNRKLREVGGSK